MRGWVNYFRHAVSKHTMKALDNFVWNRAIRWPTLTGQAPGVT